VSEGGGGRSKAGWQRDGSGFVMLVVEEVMPRALALFAAVLRARRRGGGGRRRGRLDPYAHCTRVARHIDARGIEACELSGDELQNARKAVVFCASSFVAVAPRDC
jgi:hypothetical protein